MFNLSIHLCYIIVLCTVSYRITMMGPSKHTVTMILLRNLYVINIDSITNVCHLFYYGANPYTNSHIQAVQNKHYFCA